MTDLPTFRASSVGYCSPQLLDTLRNPKKEELKYNDKALFLMGGHALQAATSAYFKIHGYGDFDEEKEVSQDFINTFDNPFSITGHIDIVNVCNEVIEIKWIMRKNFIKLQKDPASWVKLYPQYRDQLATYMVLNISPAGHMIICSRDSGETISPFFFPGKMNIHSDDLVMEQEEADSRFEEIGFKLSCIVEAYNNDTIITCDKEGWCFYCNPPKPNSSMGGTLKPGIMSEGERMDLLLEASRAIKNAG